jgi:hypothetical protein
MLLAGLRAAVRREGKLGHPAPRQGTLSPALLMSEWILDIWF